ncbi:MAG: VapE domain-containing protein [Verrucomicrobiota bacterium]
MNNQKPTTLQAVQSALQHYQYSYDSRRGWILTGNTLPHSDLYTIIATKITNYLESIQSPTLPSQQKIISQLELLQGQIQDKYADECWDNIKFNPAAIDTSESMMRLISGNNYNPIYPAILRQLLYSIKSKMIGKAVASPIFPIFYGRAGTGKSRFIRAFAKPIPEHKYAFIQAGDKLVNSESHTAMLHDNYLIHLDEMSGLNKADIGKLKTLDAPTISYRPLYTNTTKRAFNCSTLIGATNTSVKNILISTDDNRKWVQLNFYEPPIDNTEVFIRGIIDDIESFDYINLWQSVNEDGLEPFSDPSTYTLYKQYVREVCNSTTPTTNFIDEYLVAHADTWISKKDLYKTFKEEVDTKLNPMREDLFFETCEKRGFVFHRKPGVGTYGYDVPAIKKEEEF